MLCWTRDKVYSKTAPLPPPPVATGGNRAQLKARDSPSEGPHGAGDTEESYSDYSSYSDDDSGAAPVTFKTRPAESNAAAKPVNDGERRKGCAAAPPRCSPADPPLTRRARLSVMRPRKASSPLRTSRSTSSAGAGGLLPGGC